MHIKTQALGRALPKPSSGTTNPNRAMPAGEEKSPSPGDRINSDVKSSQEDYILNCLTLGCSGSETDEVTSNSSDDIGYCLTLGCNGSETDEVTSNSSDDIGYCLTLGCNGSETDEVTSNSSNDIGYLLA